MVQNIYNGVNFIPQYQDEEQSSKRSHVVLSTNFRPRMAENEELKKLLAE